MRDELLRAVYDKWDAAYVQAESDRLDSDVALISAWGNDYAQPTSDSLAIPQDVEDIDLR